MRFIGRMRLYNGHMTSLEILAQNVGVNERTLRRAVNEGTLHGSRTSPRTLELSLAERRYIRRAWPLLGTLRRALRTEPNVLLAVLFGSAATGSDTHQSDVDIAVELRDDSIDRIADLTVRLERATGRRVDLLRLDDIAREPTIALDVGVQGRALVDRDGQWTRRKAELADGPDTA